MGDGPISAVEAVVFLAVMLFIVKLVVDALEAAPIDFESQADDVSDYWGDSDG